MEINAIKRVRVVDVTTFPGWKDIFINPQKRKIRIPGEFFEGSDWIINHLCAKCKNELDFSKSRFKRLGRLSINRITNLKVLNILGQLFKLNLKAEVDENNFQIYDYSLKGKYKDIASVGYYLCEHCSSQYLFVYCDIHGDEDRTPAPDKVYIEEIMQVEFNNDIF